VLELASYSEAQAAETNQGLGPPADEGDDGDGDPEGDGDPDGDGEGDPDRDEV